MKFSSLIVFMSAWSLLVYSPVAHSVWYVSSNGFDDKTNGWLTFGRLYRKDMPDGSVVRRASSPRGAVSCDTLFNAPRAPPPTLPDVLLPGAGTLPHCYKSQLLLP